ncbi:MAG: hypothetical protein ACYTG7_18015 [Planctomycetota bacterium]|jgi:hypothetical protein
MKGKMIYFMKRELLLILAWALGIFLRFAFLPEQIIADDEWHALNAALSRGLIEVLTHFGIADYCIPLAIYDKLLLGTVGISEMLMRAPMLFFGIAGLIVLPLMVRPWTGRAGSIVFAWLLAVSPMHVYFSRYARPYAISLFLAFAGLIAAYQWWSSGNRRWAVFYAFCAVLAPYFHLSSLAVMAAPLIFFGGELLLRKKTRTERRWRDLFILGGVIGVFLSIILLPPLIVGLADLTGKMSKSSIQWHTIIRALEIWSGTVSKVYLAIMTIFAFAGSIILARKHPRFLAYLAWVVILQCMVMLIAQPLYIDRWQVLTRYAIVFMPIGLALLSTGLGGFETLLRRAISMIPSGVLAVPAALILLLTGPMITAFKGPNNWTNHSYFQYVYDPDARYEFAAKLLVTGVPSFYGRLREEYPGSLRIVEAPWYHKWPNIPFVVYQRFHRQWVAIGFVNSRDKRERYSEVPLSDPRFRFRNFVHVGDEEGLSRLGVDYVVFHRNLRGEIPNTTEKEPLDVTKWINHYKSVHGEAVFDDQGIVVYKVSGKALRDRSMPATSER